MRTLPRILWLSSGKVDSLLPHTYIYFIYFTVSRKGKCSLRRFHCKPFLFIAFKKISMNLIFLPSHYTTFLSPPSTLRCQGSTAGSLRPSIHSFRFGLLWVLLEICSFLLVPSTSTRVVCQQSRLLIS